MLMEGESKGSREGADDELPAAQKRHAGRYQKVPGAQEPFEALRLGSAFTLLLTSGTDVDL